MKCMSIKQGDDFFSQLLPLLTYGMGKTNGVLVIRLHFLMLFAK